MIMRELKKERHTVGTGENDATAANTKRFARKVSLTLDLLIAEREEREE